jgi:hypothetical protein
MMTKKENDIITKYKDGTVYFYGFDYLRILFSLSVVAWHTQLLGAPLSKTQGTHLAPNLTDIIYFNVFLDAVPLFLLVSLFLYIFNRKSKKNYFVKRSKHIFFLYLFWTLVSVALLEKGITLQKLLKVSYILSGADYATYFLLEILIMTAIVEVMLQIKPRLKPSYFNFLTIFLLGVSCVITVILSLIDQANIFFKGFSFLLDFYSPLNFLPYPFLAIILYELYSRNNKILNIKPILLLFLAMVLSIFVEWKILPDMPPYFRLSVVFAAVSLLVCFFNFDVEGGKIIKTLSETTLGAFLLHGLIIHYYPTM